MDDYMEKFKKHKEKVLDRITERLSNAEKKEFVKFLKFYNLAVNYEDLCKDFGRYLTNK